MKLIITALVIAGLILGALAVVRAEADTSRSVSATQTAAAFTPGDPNLFETPMPRWPELPDYLPTMP